ncbi:MAG: hypothetical protein IKG67_03365 [Parasporobacterium sp.]|nr:hypothetical protein [Parasporobacterium sp.]
MKDNQSPVLYKIEEQPALPEQADGRQLQYLEVKRRELSGSKQKVQKPGIRKKLVRTGTASLLGLSITLAGLFGTPEELVRQQTISQLHNQDAIELVLEDEDPGSEEDLRKKAETRPMKKGFFQKIADAAKSLIYKIPAPVRAVVGIPLWAAGYAVLHLLSGVYSVLLAPVISHIIGFVLCAIILLAVFVLTMKSIFPNMPLKKILRKGNLIRVLIGAAVLKVLDIVLPLFWPDYTRFKYLIMVAAGVIVLAVIILPRILRKRRRKVAAA